VARENEHVSYYNSGCWTELPCHYLTVRDGVVQLHAYADVVRTPVVEAEPEICAAPSPAEEADPVAYAIP
jgi:hypothetical protein